MVNCFLFLFTTLFSPLLPPDTVRQVVQQQGLCTQDTLLINSIRFQGNQKQKTKEKILRIELDFKEGDRIPAAELADVLERNRLRLFNLQLFLWVNPVVSCQDGRVDVVFTFQERWYLWPTPIFSLADRNINAWLDKWDFNRLDYGLHLVQYNFRGRNETLKTNLQHGFNRKYELFYAIPYISRKHRIGLDVGLSHYQSHSVEYNTINDTLATFRDDYSFPIQRSYVSAAVVHRQNVERQTSLGLAYHEQRVIDTVLQLNPDFFLYGRSRRFLETDLVKTINLRNTFAYPLTGSFFQVSLWHQQFLQQTGRYNAGLRIKYAHYYKVAPKYYYSYMAEGQARLGSNIAYYDNSALGYKSYIRGYELYVINGQHYGLLKQGFSRNLLNKQLFLKFIPNPRFNSVPIAIYANIFTDAAYVADRLYDEQNKLGNRLLYSGGIGLHFVTYYDRVVTFEFSMNREKKSGLFIHTQFPF